MVLDVPLEARPRRARRPRRLRSCRSTGSRRCSGATSSAASCAACTRSPAARGGRRRRPPRPARRPKAPPAARRAPLARAVVERGAGPLAAILEQREAALALEPAGGDGVAAAVARRRAWSSRQLPCATRSAALWRARRPRRRPRRQGAAGVRRGAVGTGLRHGHRRLPAGARDAGEGAHPRGARPAASRPAPAGGVAPGSSASRRRRHAAARSRGAARGASPPRSGRGSLELGLERLFREVELPLVRVLARMEEAGVRMDPYRLGEITARVRDRVDELTDRIHELAGGPFTIGSPQQLAEVLFGASASSRCARARPATRPTPACCARCASSTRSSPPSRSGASSPSCSTPTSSRFPEYIDPRTGRLHTTFNQTVAATGPALERQPEPAEHPGPHRAGGRDPRVLRRRGGAHVWSSPTTRRSSCASWPSSPARRRCSTPTTAARTSTA